MKYLFEGERVDISCVDQGLKHAESIAVETLESAEVKKVTDDLEGILRLETCEFKEEIKKAVLGNRVRWEQSIKKCEYIEEGLSIYDEQFYTKIIDHIRSIHHPNFAEKNRAATELLFNVLVNYYLEMYRGQELIIQLTALQKYTAAMRILDIDYEIHEISKVCSDENKLVETAMPQIYFLGVMLGILEGLNASTSTVMKIGLNTNEDGITYH